jgi:hypothetical protein
MYNLLHIALRAINHDQNIDREYRILLGKDLFADWIATLFYGRYRTRGTQKTHVFATDQEALRFIEVNLKKRLSARKRIGYDYQLVYLEGTPEMLPSLKQKIIDKFSILPSGQGAFSSV